ncbi:NUDIX hydrolase [uncultured Cyclobacterium sp.]|uniref:NUDIX hydrolase n=1 Tax=uncultured Cyclobacterium sp. TaxID=453820 RepID=UPI0030EC2457|tara:strand:+ start:89939 stop:90673 length:735 start_codon:yes stop_codon:yes gene_type:complete
MDLLNSKNYIPQVAVDFVVFGYENHQLKVLVSKLNFQGDFYTLQSGFIKQEEDLDDAAKRILEERTGIKGIYLEQFKVFGKANHKRKEFIDELISSNFSYSEASHKSNLKAYKWFIKRFLSIGYYSLVDMKKVIPKLTSFDAEINWYSVHEVPKLIMHYDEVLAEALDAIKADIDQKHNAFNLLPEKFTMKEIQQVYETIFDHKYIRSNFQKKILEMNALERLEKKYTGAKNKAPYLYKLKETQ